MSREPTKSPSDPASTSARPGSSELPDKVSASDEIAAFVAKAKAMSPHASGARGRLVFALDATMSRQPTWDMACSLQADMFREAASIGSLDIQLVYYRGLNECRASGWVSDSAQAGGADEPDRLPRRQYPDRQGAVGHQARGGRLGGACAGVRRRRHGGAGRRAVCQGRRTGPAEGAGVHVPGGPGRRRRTGVPRDCAADRRCLVPVRSRRGGAIARIAARRRRLCGRRAGGVAAACPDRPVARRGCSARCAEFGVGMAPQAAVHSRLDRTIWMPCLL